MPSVCFIQIWQIAKKGNRLDSPVDTSPLTKLLKLDENCRKSSVLNFAAPYGPVFRIFIAIKFLMLSCFLVAAQFGEKCPKWSEKDLDVFEVESTTVQIFLPFTVLHVWVLSYFTAQSEKVHPVTSKWCRWKVAMDTSLCPWGSNFHPPHSTIGHFWGAT